MKITIKKQDAIAAIWSEPIFKSGKWFNTSSYEYSPQEIKNCAVCGVGSVLRKHLLKLRSGINHIAQCIVSTEQESASYYGCSVESITLVLADNGDKAYLNNLSLIFESVAERYSLEDIKTLLVNEIEAMWPDKFTYHIN